MKLFVTGSTGFIGSHFLRAALAAEHDVVALRYPGSNPVVPIPESNRLTWIDGDLNSFLTEGDEQKEDRTSAADNSPRRFASDSSTALVHLAAYGVSPQPCVWQKAFQINVVDTVALMERAIGAGVSRIILCGTCMEYGKSGERYDFIPTGAPLEPMGPYATSKAALSLAAQALCRERSIDLTILRLFTVFGIGQHPSNLWPGLRQAALSGEDFPMSFGEQVRDFVPVEAVAQAFLHAIDCPSPSLVANVGTGRPQTVLEFAEFWWKKLGATGKLLPGKIPYRPDEVMRYVPEVSPLFR